MLSFFVAITVVCLNLSAQSSHCYGVFFSTSEEATCLFQPQTFHLLSPYSFFISVPDTHTQPFLVLAKHLFCFFLFLHCYASLFSQLNTTLCLFVLLCSFKSRYEPFSGQFPSTPLSHIFNLISSAPSLSELVLYSLHIV